MTFPSRILIVVGLITVLGCGGGGGSTDLLGAGDPGAGDPGAEDPGAWDPAGAEATCNAAGLEIVSQLNAYRAQFGLPAIPVSPSLCYVANLHVRDLAQNHPDEGPGCNLHSWSDAGPWSSCCYTPDHVEAACMWSKPIELTDYPSSGYENAASGVSTPAQAMGLWIASSGHNDVMVNQGIWSSYTWQAVGAALHEGYAVLWFGAAADPASGF